MGLGVLGRVLPLSGQGCDGDHGAFLCGGGVEGYCGLFGPVDPDVDVNLGKAGVWIVIGVFAPFLDAGDGDSEVLQGGAEEMGPTLECVLGPGMSEGPVGGGPGGLVCRRPLAHDEVGVAVRQGVEHGVVGGADGTTEGFLGWLAAGQEAADPEEFYRVHRASSWSTSLRGT